MHVSLGGIIFPMFKTIVSGALKRGSWISDIKERGIESSSKEETKSKLVSVIVTKGDKNEDHEVLGYKYGCW